MAAPTSMRTEWRDDPRLRRAVTGGAFGFFVDMYDVYLPTIALAPALAYFTPSSVSASTKAVVTALVFVATLVGRPLGSVIFGPLADRIGRRRVTLWSVAGCGVTTLLIAALPGYRSWGLWAVSILIALRLVDGVFLGGEYTGAMPLAMETAPDGRRGFYGSVVGMGFPLAYCAIALLTFVTLHLAPAHGPSSAYETWGWRIPFVFGALLSLVFLLYYSRRVEESPVFESAPRSRRPLRTILTGPSRRSFLQVALCMVGVWFASNMASALLPTTLAKRTTIGATAITGVLVVAQAVHALCFPAFGALVDRIGRRPFLVACGVAVGTVCAACFAYLAAGVRSGLVAVFVLTLVIRLSGASMFAITPSYICERFPARVRGSGYGLAYSMPLLATAGYAYYQEWLAHIMPSLYTPVVLLVLGGILIVVGAAIGPETRDVRFAVDERAGAEPAMASGRLDR